jgi:hypothetical protein
MACVESGARPFSAGPLLMVVVVVVVVENAKPGRANIQVVGVGISMGASTANAALIVCNENGGG